MTAAESLPPRDPPRPDIESPFLRRTAVRAGISDERLGGPQFRRLFRGVHVHAGVPVTLSLRARAALEAAPRGSIVSHHSAARLWGGSVPDTSDVHLTLPPGTTMRRAGIVAHRPRALPPARLRRGVPVTGPEGTFVALAAYLTLIDLVVLGDSLVRAGATAPDHLTAAANASPGRWSRRAKAAAALVRVGVDSPPETRLRLLLVLAGLSEPVVDHRIFAPDGRLLYRFDLAFPAIKLAIEYDGRHHELFPQRGRDVFRREDLEADGWTFVVVVAEHLTGDPGEVLARVARALRRLGSPVSPQLDQQWRLHFSQRERTA